MKYNRIILISIDALSRKYQHLFEDYFTTKYINYHTTSTWTLPSHVTMLSGILLPKLYYVMNQKDTEAYKNIVLYVPTLATLLRRVGFKSRAITGGGFMSKYFGWGHDWDNWQEALNPESEWQGEKILPKKNEFLFLHTYYIHNWFNETEKLKNQLYSVKKKLEKGEKYYVSSLVKEGKKAYLKRVKKLAKNISWIKTQPPETLIILTSDHAELFSNTKSFHHGNFALEDQAIFDVPLLIREDSKTKKIIRYHNYDYLLPKIIFDKLEKPFESVPKYLIKLNQQLSNELDKTRTQVKLLNNIIDNIKKSKTFRLWQAYCRVRKIIIGK